MEGLNIFIDPSEFYKIGNGGELVLKNRQNTIDMVYPILGNYAILDFTKNQIKSNIIGDNSDNIIKLSIN